MSNMLETSIFPTIDELLQLPAFENCVVIAGKEGLCRTAKGVNLSDTPDYYKWLSEGEIIASTCYAIHKSEDAISSFVPKVHEKGLSGIFIKPKQYLGDIPQVMIRHAESYGLPLIELPDSVRLSEIVKAVFDVITSRETAILKQSLAVNSMLIQTILEGADLKSIADMLADQTGKSVIILDSVNHRRAMSIAPEEAGIFANLETEKIAERILENAREYPLQAEGATFGQIYFYGKKGVSGMEETLLTQILSVIPLEISGRHSTDEARQREFSAFIFHLFSDPITDLHWEGYRAGAFGMRANDAHVVLRLKIETEDTPGAGEKSGIFQRTLLIGALKTAFSGAGFDLRTIDSAEEIIFIASAGAAQADTAGISKDVRRITADVLRQYRHLKVTGGMGAVNTGISGLIKSNTQAEICVKVAGGIGRQVIFFDELGILRLVYSNNPEYEVSNFLHEVLRDLLTKNQSRNTELLCTLESYLRNSGNVRQVSKELFTHYNTVSYRLKNIEDITGRSLKNPDDRFLLDLAMRLLRITSGTAD